MIPAPPSRHQAGLSLIEILISLALGLLVLAGVVSVYLASRQSYVVSEALAVRQEAIRFVSAALAKDVRMAGYLGCLRDDGALVRNTLNPEPATTGGARNDFTHTDFRYRFERFVEGFNADGAGWLPALPTEITNVVPGTDVLTVRAATDPEVYIVKEMPTQSADLKSSPLNPAPLADGDIVLITDCGGASIFQITNYTVAADAGNGKNYGNIVHNAGGGGGLPSPGNWTKDLGRAYAVGSQILRIGTISYYIRNSANGSGPALWRHANGTAVEIAEGVENMQILYGVDSNGDEVVDTYSSAATFLTAADWRRVVSVRVALLVASTGTRAVPGDPRTFDLLGTSVGPFTDGRLRRVVTLTLSLRNRLP